MNSKNNIIAIDSAGSILNISLYKDCEITSIKGEGESSNNEELASLLKKILDDNSLSINNVNTILINKGPGSFTGLRIGYAFLEGIMMSVSINVAEITLLEALRHIYSDAINESDLICQHIRKSSYFVYNVKENKLEFIESESIKEYLKAKNSKAFVINKIEDEYKSFDYELLDLSDSNLPSKILIEYYINHDVQSVSNITDLEPNYIQKISAKKISERIK